MSAATVMHHDSQTGIITFNLDVDPDKDITDFGDDQDGYISPPFIFQSLFVTFHNFSPL